MCIYINEQARIEEARLGPCQALVPKSEKQRSWEKMGGMRGCTLPLCPLSSGPAAGLSSITHLRSNKDVGATLSLAWLFIFQKASPRLWTPQVCWSFCGDSMTRALTCILASYVCISVQGTKDDAEPESHCFLGVNSMNIQVNSILLEMRIV